MSTLVEKEISTGAFSDFLTQVESLVKEGYTFDLESNARFPQAFPHRFFVVMVKGDPEYLIVPPAPLEPTPDAQEAPTPAKRGPKPRNQN